MQSFSAGSGSLASSQALALNRGTSLSKSFADATSTASSNSVATSAANSDAHHGIADSISESTATNGSIASTEASTTAANSFAGAASVSDATGGSVATAVSDSQTSNGEGDQTAAVGRVTSLAAATNGGKATTRGKSVLTTNSGILPLQPDVQTVNSNVVGVATASGALSNAVSTIDVQADNVGGTGNADSGIGISQEVLHGCPAAALPGCHVAWRLPRCLPTHPPPNRPTPRYASQATGTNGGTADLGTTGVVVNGGRIGNLGLMTATADGADENGVGSLAVGRVELGAGGGGDSRVEALQVDSQQGGNAFGATRAVAIGKNGQKAKSRTGVQSQAAGQGASSAVIANADTEASTGDAESQADAVGTANVPAGTALALSESAVEGSGLATSGVSLRFEPWVPGSLQAGRGVGTLPALTPLSRTCRPALTARHPPLYPPAVRLPGWPGGLRHRRARHLLREGRPLRHCQDYSCRRLVQVQRLRQCRC